MTTPLGVPNLPVGALTVETLGEVLQDMSAAAMRARAGERFPDIFNLTTGGDVLDDLTPFGILSAIWAAFNSQVATSDPADIQGPEDLPGLLLDFIEELPIIGILVKFVEALGFAPEMAESFLRPIFEFLDWLWQLVGEEAEGILKPIFEFLNWLFTEYGDEVETFLQPIADFLKWLLDFIIARIDLAPFQALVEELVDALGGFVSAQGFVDLLTKLIEFFANLFRAVTGQLSIADLFNQIPIISSLVAVITGKTSADGVALDLATLGQWARDVEKNSKGALDAITQLGVKLLGGTLLPPPDGNTEINLLSQGDFPVVENIDPADGWSWDNTTSSTAGGGSAKLVATGTHRLYSKQSITVQAGDVLTVACKVKTSGFTAGTGRSMALSLVHWNGTSRILDGSGNPTNVQFTPRTTPASDWVSISGTYTVPAGVSSVQVRLAVTANSGATIWFDDVSVKKKSNMGQDYVSNLIQAWRDIYFRATGTASNVFWDSVGLAIGGVKTLAGNAFGGVTTLNGTLFDNPEEGGTTIVIDAIPVTAIGDELGTPLPTGSGGRMYRASGLVDAAAGPAAHVFSSFYSNADSSPDITASTSGGSFTVTYAGYYQVEVGFTVNAVPEFAGAFNVAPAVFVGNDLYKVGGAAFGSYAFGLGGYGRSAHSTFIVYLNAGQAVKAGYYNWFSGINDDFFDGGAASTYFSIAMLNRTDEG